MSKSKTKKSSHKVSKNKTVFFTLISICLIFIISYVFSLNFLEIYNIYKEKQNLKNEIAELTDNEEKLKDQVSKLKDPEYIARYAREKYLYSKDGEFIIKLP